MEGCVCGGEAVPGERKDDILGPHDPGPLATRDSQQRKQGVSE